MLLAADGPVVTEAGQVPHSVKPSAAANNQLVRLVQGELPQVVYVPPGELPVSSYIHLVIVEPLTLDDDPLQSQPLG